MARAVQVLALLFLLARDLLAQSEALKPEAPVDYANKFTLGVYEQASRASLDLNFRHQRGAVTSWLGTFLDPDRHLRGRAGVQYGWQRDGLMVQPAIEAGTTGFLMGTVYSEAGGALFGIAGYSRTNLKVQNDITFDPNDSAQVGVGWKGDSDRIAIYSIFDIRLHTNQQDTHLVWKHRLDPRSALTVDTIYKSGLTDSGRAIRAIGSGLYYDRGWFAKAYYDPYANFGDRTQWRLSVGRKF